MTGCLEATGVWKRYRNVTALAGVSTRVCRGLTVLAGPNGSGKSTLIKLYAGLSRPTRGTVRSLGMDPWREKRRLLRRLSAGLESTRLPWWMTGWEVLELVASELDADPGEMAEIAVELGLGLDALHRRVRGYSMGMRKKLLLSIALRPGLEAYLLDEPYTLIDRETRAKLDKIILDRSKTSIVLVASHMMTEALQEADKLLLLENGRLVLETSRMVPGKAYKCPPQSVQVEELISRLGARRVVVERDHIVVIFEEEAEPPMKDCKPILPLL